MSLHLMCTSTPQVAKDDETDAEKKKRIGFPKYDVEALMKEVGCEQYIVKL